MLSLIPFCVKSNTGAFSGAAAKIVTLFLTTVTPAVSKPEAINLTMFTVGVSEFLA